MTPPVRPVRLPGVTVTAERPERRPSGLFALLTDPEARARFAEASREHARLTRPRPLVPISRFVGPEVTAEQTFNRRRALDIVERLGPGFDYRTLESALAKSPEPLPNAPLLAEVVALGRESEAIRTSAVMQTAAFAGALGARAAENITFGLLRPPEEESGILGPKSKVVANVVGDLVGAGTLGIGTYKLVGRFSQKIATQALLENVPQRLRSILLTGGAGGAAGAVIELARPEGLPEEPHPIDIPARIGRFIEPVTGERLGLALGGAAIGSALDLTLGSIIRGASLMRENRLINRELSDELVEPIRAALTDAGIPIGPTASKAKLVRTLLANQGKIRQTAPVAEILAANNARAEHVVQLMLEHPDRVLQRPNLPESVAVDAAGKPVRVYHGSPAMISGELQPREGVAGDFFGSTGIFFTEDPRLANVFTRVAGEFTPSGATAGATARLARTPAAPSVTPSYLDIRDPLDIARAFDDRAIDALAKVVVPGASKSTLKTFRENMRTYGSIADYITEDPAGLVGTTRSRFLAQAAREANYDGIVYPAWLEQDLFGLEGVGDPASRIFIAFRGNQIKPAFQVNEDPVYLASLFINNPTGISIAKGVLSPEAVTDAARILGVRMAAVRAGENVLVMRPTYNLPDVKVPESLVTRLRATVKAENRGFRAEPVMHILPDGRRLVGRFDAVSFARSGKITVPQGLSAEKAVREKLLLLSAELTDNGAELIVTLPGRVTNSQLADLARFVDGSSVRRVTIMPTKAGQTAAVLDNPIGMQVQDGVARQLGLPDPQISDEVAKLMAQFTKTGVFKGQAAVLETGYAVEVLGRGKKGVIKVRDPFSGEISSVDESRLGLLSTSLEGVTTPNRLLLEKLTPEELKLYTDVMRSANLGFTGPLRSSRQLEAMANARGLYVDKLSAGGYRIRDPISGETNLYADLKAAGAGMKEMSGPLPDLTPPEMQELLGNTNFGMIGPGGPPPSFGEMMPLPDDFDIPEDFGRVLGTLRKAITPTRGLLLDAERIYGVPLGRTFLAVQEQLVHKENFLATWISGELPGMPTGVRSLKDITKRAGKGANQELITAWMESTDDASRALTASRMTSREIEAAKDLRKWYDALFERFGIEREYLTDYAPHIRVWADRFDGNVEELWRRTRGTALPKGVDFIADHIRQGTLNIYETRAFISAMQYVSAGSNNRFMKGVLEEARQVLWRIPDNAVKGPLVNYLEALRGVEFAPQRAAMKASIDNMVESLGMKPSAVPGTTDRLVLNLLGMGYAATMGFRPGLAMRNMTQTLQTTWTMFGGTDNTLLEAIGKAMTKAGRDQAILDGAISIRTGGVYAAEEIAEAMPDILRGMTGTSMKLYNGADMWNRAVAYWTGRVRAEKAIAAYARTTAGGGKAAIAKARERLIKDSGLFWFDKPVQDEFYRRLLHSPEKAAAWIGKNAADVTQYLYGRGNQAWWLRTVPGRFLGQYGTWPMWYLDFTRRTFMNAWRSGHPGEAIRFLGRLGIANGAVAAAGTAVGINLAKWTGFSSLFFTGGPGAEVIGGISTLVRGTGASLFDPDDPFAQSRMTEGARILERVGRAYIPFYYAARDLDRLMNPRSTHDAVTALLSTQPTRQFLLQERLDLLTNLGRLSTDTEIEHQKPGELTGVELMERAQRLAGEEEGSLLAPGGQQPQGQQPGGGLLAPGGATAAPTRQQPIPFPGEVRPEIR